MQRALKLAHRGLGRTSPNHLVGAVVVKEGKVVGEGYHERAGAPHAEIHALQQAGANAQGSTLYLNLEPCAHYGRTPPCTQTIINAGVRRVVAAISDPNPLVAGKGFAALRTAGIEVKIGLLRKEAKQLNEFFIKYITTGYPFVTLKVAMSLDGKIASFTGDSRWITGEKARHHVHNLRNQYDAVLVGIGTVLMDNPQLTTRLPGGQGRDAVRVVVDSQLRLPLDALLVTGEYPARTIVATTSEHSPSKKRALENAGVEVWVIVGEGPRVNLRELMISLGQREIISILVEGGATVNDAMLAAGLVDKVHFYIAPKIIGGTKAPGPVGGMGIAQVVAAIGLTDLQVSKCGEDILVTGYLTKSN
jgi:diaminohydroxyphosphoribosylaminopyrimidine deaminase/5-amino-6-(5-phosphoribosylamino)uracil reductase